MTHAAANSELKSLTSFDFVTGDQLQLILGHIRARAAPGRKIKPPLAMRPPQLSLQSNFQLPTRLSWWSQVP